MTLTRPQALAIVPIDFDEACAFIKRHHRHHKPPVGHKFSVAVAVGENVVGVAIAGRPVGFRMQDGWTIEVTRNCTDGTKNAASRLYGACIRVSLALGYRRVITYTLKSESGSSLKAAGFTVLHETPGRSWSTPSRPRVDKHPLEPRLCWGVSA